MPTMTSAFQSRAGQSHILSYFIAKNLMPNVKGGGRSFLIFGRLRGFGAVSAVVVLLRAARLRRDVSSFALRGCGVMW
jgi:hypothetical protein